MQQVVIVTDSTADIPEEIANDLGIRVIPLRVIFQGETYKDKVDMNLDEFYQRMREVDEFPTTSQPPPGDFIEVFNQIHNNGQKAIAILLSSKISGTGKACELAGSMIEGFDMTVVDSKTVTLPLGLVAIEAAKAAKKGKSKEEILELIESLLPKSRIYFMVNTLEYLYKGGRIGGASAFLGGLLNIKPILTVNNGIVDAHERVRGQHRALDRILSLVDEQAKNGFRSLAVVHVGALEDGQKLYSRLKEKYSTHDIFITNVSAVLGTHVGPGCVGIGFIRN